MFDFHIISRPLEKDIQPHFESMADSFYSLQNCLY